MVSADGKKGNEGSDPLFHALLLPGLDGTGDLFTPLVDYAPKNVHSVVVRYPVDETSIDAFERIARSKLIAPCIIIAESFSGPIGVRIASDPRVRALVLCNSFVTSPMPLAFRHVAVAAFFSIPLPHFVLRSLLLGSHASPGLVQSAQHAIRRVPPNVLATRVQEVFRTDERPALQALTKPILYLRGSEDFIVSNKCWTDLKAVRPDASIVSIKGPHLLLQTSPRECWDAIAVFLR
ncbi:MAG TPA: hypothetical protein VFO86_14640 [Terriglobia bacterium]|nr:hypothetical protein [Terriglobia bacterium]